jgi:alpha-beta hydrolase superfamily lysophospholipase
MTPSSPEPAGTRSTFTDAHGVEVAYRCWTPPAATGIVLVLHGASEHSGRYGRFADALVAEGWAVYAPDHRGHGATAGATGRGAPGPGGLDAILDDVHQLREEAIASAGAGVPVVVFGHSMGSLLALAYAERWGGGLAGCVLCGSPGVADGVGELAGAIESMVESGMADEKVDALSPFNVGFEPARTPFDWLSRDEAEVDAYLADPDCGERIGMTYGFLSGILALSADAMSASGLASLPGTLPVLLVTGERDPVSNDGANVRRLEEMLRHTGRDVTSRYYPDARHELLNETNRDEVTADVLTWLRARR